MNYVKPAIGEFNPTREPRERRAKALLRVIKRQAFPPPYVPIGYSPIEWSAVQAAIAAYHHAFGV